ncbi:hypothetical protein ACGF13_01985 [Kitasatospora sp. NPDC048286]|uniref:hypothetical protein n=1 Tax=Kitasatospora sp. NPDC048286 TaxID=3364047 RepID=UPI003722018F
MAKVFRHDTVEDWVAANPGRTLDDLLLFLKAEADEARDAAIQAQVDAGTPRERAATAVALINYHENR